MFLGSQQITGPWEGMVLSAGVPVRTWFIKSIKSSRERNFVNNNHEYANNDDCKVVEQGNISFEKFVLSVLCITALTRFTIILLYNYLKSRRTTKYIFTRRRSYINEKILTTNFPPQMFWWYCNTWLSSKMI